MQYLGHYQPDILMLQELKTLGDSYPFEEIEAMGYHSHIVGQKTYNGVAIMTKNLLNVELSALPGDEADEQARFIQMIDPQTGWRLINIYLPNGNPTKNDDGSDHEKFIYKRQWMQRLYDHIKGLDAQDIPFLIAGDWNIAPKDSDAYDANGWKDDALLQPSSRALYYQITHLGLTDALKTVNPNIGYTWWDYRGGGFKRNHGLRIDHILLSSHLADRLENAGVHEEMRALERPSDHAPVWAVLSTEKDMPSRPEE